MAARTERHERKKTMTTQSDRIITLVRTAAMPSTLLDFLLAALSHLSRTSVKALLRNSRIKVGQTVTTRFDFPVNEGETVAVNMTREWPVLKNPRLEILYEDVDIIVVSKGYGLLSMATDKKNEVTAYSLLRDYVKKNSPHDKIFIVHRLDRHTSGVMVFAKTEEAKNNLQHNWNNMVLERKYIAVIEGCPERKEGVQKSYLAENSRHIVYSTSKPEEGQFSVTRWKILKKRGQYSLVELSLDTGRKNQIRVHMKELGHPIAGDRKYGAVTSPIHRVALHAATLRFIHPITRKDMNFSTPVPASFNRLV